MTMAKLSDKVKKTIAEVRPAMIATAARSGRPNVSAKGSLKVLDDDHLVFADINSPGTIANLKENPEISILVVHPRTMEGCRIWGKGEIFSSGELFESIKEEYAARSIAVNNVVKIAVDEARDSF